MAAKTNCPSCGGPARGRGYTHTETCSEFKGRSKNPRKGDSLNLKTMGVEQLIQLRTHVEELIKERAPEVKERITELQKLLKSIS